MTVSSPLSLSQSNRLLFGVSGVTDMTFSITQSSRLVIACNGLVRNVCLYDLANQGRSTLDLAAAQQDNAELLAELTPRCRVVYVLARGRPRPRPKRSL